MQQSATDPLDEVQPAGVTVDVWLMDDQTVMCDPRLKSPIRDALDKECTDPTRGGERNCTKTHAIIYASAQQIADQSHLWEIPGIQRRATLNSPKDEVRSLGASHTGRQGQPMQDLQDQTQSHASTAPQISHH